MTPNVLSLHAYTYYVYCVYIIIEDFGYARLKYYKSVTVYLRSYSLISFPTDLFLYYKFYGDLKRIKYETCNRGEFKLSYNSYRIVYSKTNNDETLHRD